MAIVQAKNGASICNKHNSKNAKEKAHSIERILLYGILANILSCVDSSHRRSFYVSFHTPNSTSITEIDRFVRRISLPVL